MAAWAQLAGTAFFTKTGHFEGTFSCVPGKHLREGILTNSMGIQSLRGQSLGFRVSREDFCPANTPAVTVDWDLACHKSSQAAWSHSGQRQQFGKGKERPETPIRVMCCQFTSCVPSSLTGCHHSELRTCSSSEVACAPGSSCHPLIQTQLPQEPSGLC